MYILDVQSDARPVGRLNCPQVQILVPPCLKEEAIITIVQICEFVDDEEFRLAA